MTTSISPHFALRDKTRIRTRVRLAAVVFAFVFAALTRLPHAAAQTPIKPLLPRTITVRETAGLERKNWPITTNLLVAPNEAMDPANDLTLWRDAGTPQEARVALQVLA